MKFYHLSLAKTITFRRLCYLEILSEFKTTDFNGYSSIDVNQKATFPDPFEGAESRVIGCFKPLSLSP